MTHLLQFTIRVLIGILIFLSYAAAQHKLDTVFYLPRAEYDYDNLNGSVLSSITGKKVYLIHHENDKIVLSLDDDHLRSLDSICAIKMNLTKRYPLQSFNVNDLQTRLYLLTADSFFIFHLQNLSFDLRQRNNGYLSLNVKEDIIVLGYYDVSKMDGYRLRLDIFDHNLNKIESIVDNPDFTEYLVFNHTKTFDLSKNHMAFMLTGKPLVVVYNLNFKTFDTIQIPTEHWVYPDLALSKQIAADHINLVKYVKQLSITQRTKLCSIEDLDFINDSLLTIAWFRQDTIKQKREYFLDYFELKNGKWEHQKRSIECCAAKDTTLSLSKVGIYTHRSYKKVQTIEDGLIMIQPYFPEVDVMNLNIKDFYNKLNVLSKSQDPIVTIFILKNHLLNE